MADASATTEASQYRQIIDKTMEAIPANNAFSSPVVLSGFIVRLAHANAMYGRYLSLAQVQYRALRKKVFNEQIEAGAPVTRAKEEAKNAALSLEAEYDEMYNVHQDTKDFITVCMSYLKIMGIEVRLGNL